MDAWQERFKVPSSLRFEKRDKIAGLIGIVRRKN